MVIRSGERVLGAAGASGASGDDDRACVEAGLRAVLPGLRWVNTKPGIQYNSVLRQDPRLGQRKGVVGENRRFVARMGEDPR